MTLYVRCNSCGHEGPQGGGDGAGEIEACIYFHGARPLILLCVACRKRLTVQEAIGLAGKDPPPGRSILERLEALEKKVLR